MGLRTEEQQYGNDFEDGPGEDLADPRDGMDDAELRSLR